MKIIKSYEMWGYSQATNKSEPYQTRVAGPRFVIYWAFLYCTTKRRWSCACKVHWYCACRMQHTGAVQTEHSATVQSKQLSVQLVLRLCTGFWHCSKAYMNLRLAQQDTGLAVASTDTSRQVCVRLTPFMSSSNAATAPSSSSAAIAPSSSNWA